MRKKDMCCNGGKIHNFEPRYSEMNRDVGPGAEFKHYSLDELRRFLTLREYERDICTWCGKTIEKERNE